MNSWSSPTSFRFDQIIDQFQYRWSSLSVWESALRIAIVLLGAYLLWQICKYVHTQLSRMMPRYKVWLSRYRSWLELIFWSSFIVLLLLSSLANALDFFFLVQWFDCD